MNLIPQQSDESSILDDDLLWRWIKKRDLIVFDYQINAHRPSSAAFRLSSDGSGISVLIEKLILESDRSLKDVVT